MLNKLDIANRLALGFGVTLMLIAGLGVFSVYSGRSREAAAEDLTRLRTSEILVEQVQESVFQTRFRMWAYFATGNPENFQQALEELRIARERLAKLAAQPSNTVSNTQIAQTDSAIAAYREEVSRAFASRWRDKALDEPESRTRLAEAQESDTILERAAGHLSNIIQRSGRQDGQEATKAITDNPSLLMINGAICLLSTAALATLIFRTVVRPIEGRKRIITAIAGDDLCQAVPQTHEFDETRAMAVVDAELVAQQQALAAANLAEQIEQEFQANLAQKRSRDFDQSLSGRVETGANADNLRMVVGAVERLFPSSTPVAGQVHLSRQETRAVFDEPGGARKNIAPLSNGSAPIGNVVKFIKRNAPTTNLLAFNAAIEAAKAEDAGLGFAVAAGEINRLVNQTQSAGHIGAQSAVHAMGPAFSGMGEINRFSTIGYEAVGAESLDTANIARSPKRAAAKGFDAGQLLFTSQFLFTCRSLRLETAIMQEKMNQFLDVVRKA